MTIDEAIEKARNNAVIQRNNQKLNYTLGKSSPYYNLNCDKYAEYHEQIVEWLEELKEIKSNGRYVQGNKAGQKIGYRNAIDDLSNKICMHFSDWEYSEDDKCIKDIIELASESVEEIAERLRADNTNE